MFGLSSLYDSPNFAHCRSVCFPIYFYVCHAKFLIQRTDLLQKRQ